MSKCFTSYKSPLLSFVPELDDGLQILTCTSFPSPVPKFEWWVSSLSGCSLPRRRSPLLLLLLVLSPPPPVAPTTTSPLVIFHRFVTYFVTYFVLWMIFVTLFIEATQFCMTCDVFAFSRFWQHHLQFLVTSHKIHFLLYLVLSSLMLSTDFCWDQVSLVVKNSLFWRFVASSLLALGGKDFELFISLVESED